MTRSLGDRFKRRRKGVDDNVLPLINVVFLLLAFFMIAGQITNRAPVKVTPPTSVSERHQDINRPAVYVTREGGLNIEGAVITIAALKTALPRNEASGELRIMADKDTPAEIVVRLMTALRGLGWAKAYIVTQKGE